VQRLRTVPDAAPRGLAVAGAWTETGWPDTMEGAVRSGRSAARKLIADLAGAAAHADEGVTAAAAPSVSGR
jgi:monoamine oxidase